MNLLSILASVNGQPVSLLLGKSLLFFVGLCVLIFFGFKASADIERKKRNTANAENKKA